MVPNEFRLRVLPDFVIAGVARCGTSSLADWLGQHPEIHTSPVKETNFFSRPDLHTNGPGDDELNHPPTTLPDGSFERIHVAGIFSPEDYERCLQSADEGKFLRGEASVSYSFYPEAARRLHEANPECRVVLLLRDPVARAWSNYLFFRKLGRETLSFADALAQESERFRQGYEFAWAYGGLSRYRRALQNLLRYFPIEQIHCAQFESLIVRSEHKPWEELLLFLGVDCEFEPHRTHLAAHTADEMQLEATLTKRIHDELRDETDFYEMLFASGTNRAELLRSLHPVKATQAGRDWRSRLRVT